MGKLHILFLLNISSLMLIPNAQTLIQGSENTAKFTVYIQDVLGGPNATVYEVARANITSISPTNFGLVRVIDVLITAEPDANSEKLGRAQGLITLSDMKEVAMTMNINFVFTGGEYKGSTLCIVGRNPWTKRDRELPVVGGTGVFRWARGYTISNNYTEYTPTGYGVLEYKIYVVYLEQEFGLEISDVTANNMSLYY